MTKRIKIPNRRVSRGTKRIKGKGVKLAKREKRKRNVGVRKAMAKVSDIQTGVRAADKAVLGVAGSYLRRKMSVSEKQFSPQSVTSRRRRIPLYKPMSIPSLSNIQKGVLADKGGVLSKREIAAYSAAAGLGAAGSYLLRPRSGSASSVSAKKEPGISLYEPETFQSILSKMMRTPSKNGKRKRSSDKTLSYPGTSSYEPQSETVESIVSKILPTSSKNGNRKKPSSGGTLSSPGISLYEPIPEPVQSILNKILPTPSKNGNRTKLSGAFSKGFPASKALKLAGVAGIAGIAGGAYWLYKKQKVAATRELNAVKMRVEEEKQKAINIGIKLEEMIRMGKNKNEQQTEKVEKLLSDLEKVKKNYQILNAEMKAKAASVGGKAFVQLQVPQSSQALAGGGGGVEKVVPIQAPRISNPLAGGGAVLPVQAPKVPPKKQRRRSIGNVLQRFGRKMPRILGGAPVLPITGGPPAPPPPPPPPGRPAPPPAPPGPKRPGMSGDKPKQLAEPPTGVLPSYLRGMNSYVLSNSDTNRRLAVLEKTGFKSVFLNSEKSVNTTKKKGNAVPEQKKLKSLSMADEVMMKMSGRDEPFNTMKIINLPKNLFVSRNPKNVNQSARYVNDYVGSNVNELRKVVRNKMAANINVDSPNNRKLSVYRKYATVFRFRDEFVFYRDIIAKWVKKINSSVEKKDVGALCDHFELIERISTLYDAIMNYTRIQKHLGENMTPEIHNEDLYNDVVSTISVELEDMVGNVLFFIEDVKIETFYAYKNSKKFHENMLSLVCMEESVEGEDLFWVKLTLMYGYLINYRFFNFLEVLYKTYIFKTRQNKAYHKNARGIFLIHDQTVKIDLNILEIPFLTSIKADYLNFVIFGKKKAQVPDLYLLKHDKSKDKFYGGLFKMTEIFEEFYLFADMFVEYIATTSVNWNAMFSPSGKAKITDFKSFNDFLVTTMGFNLEKISRDAPAYRKEKNLNGNYVWSGMKYYFGLDALLKM